MSPTRLLFVASFVMASGCAEITVRAIQDDPDATDSIDSTDGSDVADGTDGSSATDETDTTDDATGTEPGDCSLLTTDTCTPSYELVGTECTPVYAPSGTECDDGKVSTVGDSCNDSGVCVGALDCSDLPINECITGYEDVDGECSAITASNDTVCDDNDLCSTESKCFDGVCTAYAFILCSNPSECVLETSCNPATGTCEEVNAPNGTTCEGGNLCTPKECSDGACITLTPVDCDDSIDCTDDTCEPTTGECSNTAADTNCDDGNTCTTGTCSATTGCSYASKLNYSACGTGDEYGFCLQGNCALSQRNEPSPLTLFSCSPENKAMTGVSYVGGKFYSATNYSSQTFSGLDFECQGSSAPRTRVVEITNNGSGFDILGSTNGHMNQIDTIVTVGDEALIGLINGSEGTIDYNSDLGSAAGSYFSGGVTPPKDINTVHRNSTSSTGLGANAYHYLMGGDNGTASYCSQSTVVGSTVSCATLVFGNLPTTLSAMDFAAAELVVTNTKCVQPPCSLSTNVARAYLASNSDAGGFVDIVYASNFSNAPNSVSFSHILEVDNQAKTLRGSEQGLGAVWFFGTNNLLIRCKSGSCEEIAGPSGVTVNFVDAVSQGSNILLLAEDEGTYWIYLLSNSGGAEFVPQWNQVEVGPLTDGDYMKGFDGSTSVGYVITGHNVPNNKWVTWAYIP